MQTSSAAEKSSSGGGAWILLDLMVRSLMFVGCSSKGDLIIGCGVEASAFFRRLLLFRVVEVDLCDFVEVNFLVLVEAAESDVFRLAFVQIFVEDDLFLFPD